MIQVEISNDNLISLDTIKLQSGRQPPIMSIDCLDQKLFNSRENKHPPLVKVSVTPRVGPRSQVPGQI